VRMAFDITARIEAWQKNLLDTSKRNRLIKFTTNRAGGIAFLHPDANIVWQRLIVEGKPYSFPWKRDLVDDLLEEEEEENAEKLREYTEKCRASPFLEADDLLTEFTDKKLLANLLRLSRNASESETEHGVSTLFAPFGFLRWFESHDSTEEIRSPLVLVPVRLSRASVESPWTLKRDDDDPAVNHCLAELMATDFGIKLPRDDDAFIEPTHPMAGRSIWKK